MKARRGERVPGLAPSPGGPGVPGLANALLPRVFLLHSPFAFLSLWPNVPFFIRTPVVLE